MSLLRFHPLIKRSRWGGTLLAERFQKPTGHAPNVGESWELCDHTTDQTCVKNGVWAGKTLQELISGRRREILGRHASHTRFPLLLKFLDVHDYLSVQVHPNDAQAKAYFPGELGKNEAWVILEAHPDSRVFAGLKSGVDEYCLRAALAEGRVAELLHAEPVVPGDVLFIPAGTVHALTPGLLLAEVQQASVQTYRLYDWDRPGENGLPRELHIERALACIDFTRGPIKRTSAQILETCCNRVENLVESSWFVVRRHSGTGSVLLEEDNRFRVIMVLQGQGIVRSGELAEHLDCGETLLVCAQRPPTIVLPQSGFEWLEIYLP